MLNHDFEGAEHYARHAMFMINEMTDNFIPSEQRSYFLADGSYHLAQAIFNLAQTGGIPPGEKQKAGEEAIALACQALELHIRLYGTESAKVAKIRAYWPMCWITSSTLMMTRSFVSKSKRLPSIVECKTIRLIMWRYARRT